MTTPLCFCGKTAYRYWHSLRSDGSLRLGELRLVPRASERLGIHMGRLGYAPRKGPDEVSLKTAMRLLPPGSDIADLLVSDPAARHHCHAKNFFVCGKPLPRGSVVRIGPNVFICTPEFLALQWASTMGFLPLLALLHEFAGSYAVDRWGCTAESRCNPLVNPSALRSFLNRCAGFKGIRTTQKAALLLTGGSGSPMETAVVLLLCLPLRHGGYGLPVPRMNEHVVIPANASTTGMEHSLFCDLYWPASRVALEYDGIDFHTGSNQARRDYVRANELQAAGISIDVLTNREVFSWGLFTVAAHRIARKLGVRLRDERLDATWRAKHRELRKTLLVHRDVDRP